MSKTRDTPDLTGRSILVVEDAFYLAMEIEEAVERAGGTVLGPCADGEAGLELLAHSMPDGAVVDINLGAGPSFEVADALHAAGVPFVFLTGYDASTIPARFADVDRLLKPASSAALVRALAQAITA